jgi:polyhydroxybutyrate depolymerase
MPTTQQMWLRREGRDRDYLLHVPGPMPERMPLVVELHGRGADPLRFDAVTGFGALADQAGFALALPRAVARVWNDSRVATAIADDVGYLIAMVDDICGRVPVDPGRVYVVGMSNGATMAARLACERPERVTAFAQVAGTAAVSLSQAAPPARPVPLLQIHGTRDELMPYEGGTRLDTRRARFLLRRPGGPSVGVDDWASFWVEANDAVTGPEVREIPPDTTVRTWRRADSLPVVVFYRVADGGHTWPGSRRHLPRLLLGATSHSFDATRTIWEFFARHDGATMPPA